MKTHFHIENKEFVDYLKLTTNGKTHYFCDDLTIEFDDRENLDVDIEYVRAEDYFKIKSKNPFLKLLLSIVKWIFSPLIYFVDNDDGIRLDKGYKSFNPFTHKKSFSIISPNEKTINIHYIESKYDRTTRKYSQSSMELKVDGVIDKNEETTFSSAIFFLRHFSNILEILLTLPLTASIGEYISVDLYSIIIWLNFTSNSLTAKSYGVKISFHN